MTAREVTGDRASQAGTIDAELVQRWCWLATEALAAKRAAINALNVFPVPDADTGSNLYLTLKSASEAVADLATPAVPEPAQAGLGGASPASGGGGQAGAARAWAAVAQGALTGACGNSGIIVSQLLRGLAAICAPASPCDGAVLGAALAHAAALARESVSRPAPGTVLTVADAAAEAAAGYVQQSTDLPGVAHAAALGARAALSGTTSQLGVLAAAGVVDAGAAGLCVLLDALAAAVGHPVPGAYDVPPPGRPTGAPGWAAQGRTAEAGSPDPAGDPGDRAGGLEPPGSPGYEVTYLLAAEACPVAALRAELGRLGDSVVIVGGAPQWHVHVHLDNAGAAIEAGFRAGTLSRISVTWLGLLGGAGAAHGLAPAHQADGTAPAQAVPGQAVADREMARNGGAVLGETAVQVAAEPAASLDAAGGVGRVEGAAGPGTPGDALGIDQPAARRVVLAMAGSAGVAALLRGAGAWVLETTALTDDDLADDELGARLLAEVARVRAGAGPAERAEVVMLPDGSRTLGVARAVAERLAAGSAGLPDEVAVGDRVAVGVVNVASVLPGLAAMAVQWDGRSLADDVAAMDRAAAGMRHGCVQSQGGSLAGLVAGSVVASGTEAGPLARAVADRLLSGAAQDSTAPDVPELVTVLVAGTADGELAGTVRRQAARVAPEAEVVCYGGGPAPLLIGVE